MLSTNISEDTFLREIISTEGKVWRSRKYFLNSVENITMTQFRLLKIFSFLPKCWQSNMTKEMKIDKNGKRANGLARTTEYAEQIFISILPTLPNSLKTDCCSGQDSSWDSGWEKWLKDHVQSAVVPSSGQNIYRIKSTSQLWLPGTAVCPTCTTE